MDGWVVPEKGGNAFREPDVVERLKVDLMGIGLRTHGWRGVLGVSVGGLLVMVVVLGVLVVVLGVGGSPWGVGGSPGCYRLSLGTCKSSSRYRRALSDCRWVLTYVEIY